jgi:outer membrane protein OmpA-like peptidoglycan-associated protein
MFNQVVTSKAQKPEAEKPFWISYADLMTAMMTLCLVVMAVTIIAINQRLVAETSGEEQRAREIRDICAAIQTRLQGRGGVHVDCKDNRIDFGEAGRFGYNEYKLNPAAESSLAVLVPVVLDVANGDLGKKWLKQVVIEGYADTQGSYLYNLYLSLQRSYWVMCTLVDESRNQNLGLSQDQIGQVRELFLAGGVSFNDPKDSDEASRRVELRLQFYTRKEKEESSAANRPRIVASAVDKCNLQ